MIMEEVKDKVKRVEALAVGTVEGTAIFMEEVNLLKFTLEKKIGKLENKMGKMLILMGEILNYVRK